MKYIKKFKNPDIEKLLKKLNSLKYIDGSMVDVTVKLSKEVMVRPDLLDIEGFKFYLTDLEFEKNLDIICKECGFGFWYPSSENSIVFYLD